MNWKYTDYTQKVVFRVDGAGVMESVLVEALSSQEVIDPADVVPPVPHSVTPLTFMEFFTQDELLTIVAAAQVTPALRLWYDKLMAAQEVVDGDPRIVGGLDALLGAGLLTDSRKAEILLALKG